MSTQIGELGVTFPDSTVQTTAAVPGGAGFGGAPNVSIYTASGVWICPPGIYKVKVTVIGGGGGGYDAVDGSDPDGGQGGCAVGIYSVVPGTSYNLVVGQGGLGFVAVYADQPSPYGPGGTSSFGSFCSATGGGPAYPPNNGGPSGHGINGTLGNAIYNPGYMGGGNAYTPTPLSWSTTNGIGAGAAGIGAGGGAGANGGVMIEWWG